MSSPSSPPLSTPNTSRDPPPASAEASGSALQRAKINLSYLALGSGAAVAPSSLATRSFLTTTRYVLRYVVRRLVRYAKYAAAGALVAAIGGTLLGTLGSGLAFFAAPGIGAGMGLGVLTAVAKFGWRHRGDRMRGGIWEGFKSRAEAGRDGASDEQSDAESVKKRRQEEVKRVRQDVWMRA